MNLHTRIVLGYSYLVGLLLLGAVGAALGFHQLGANMERLLTGNLESMRASTLMLDALQRQDRAVMGALLGEEEALRLLEASEASFAEGLSLARAHVVGEEEQSVMSDLVERYDEYRAARQALLLRSSREQTLAAWKSETHPRFEAVKTRVLDLMQVNHKAIVAADQEAQRTANQRALTHGLLVAVALLSLGFLSRALRRHMLDRLEDLKSFAEAIAAGDRSRRATVDRHDELGLVAMELNAVLDGQQQLEATMEGRLAQHRQVILGLLESLGTPAALVSLSGEVVASTLPQSHLGVIRETAGQLAGAHRPTADVPWGDKKIRLRRLETEEHRAVGWLATVVAEGAVASTGTR